MTTECRLTQAYRGICFQWCPYWFSWFFWGGRGGGAAFTTTESRRRQREDHVPWFSDSFRGANWRSVLSYLLRGCHDGNTCLGRGILILWCRESSGLQIGCWFGGNLLMGCFGKGALRWAVGEALEQLGFTLTVAQPGGADVSGRDLINPDLTWSMFHRLY